MNIMDYLSIVIMETQNLVSHGDFGGFIVVLLIPCLIYYYDDYNV